MDPLVHREGKRSTHVERASLTDWLAAGDALPRPHLQCYWLVAGRVLAGEHPGLGGEQALATRLLQLGAHGVTHLLDLSHPDDAVAQLDRNVAAAAGLQYQRFAITDFGVPSTEGMRAIQSHLAAAVGQGARVYIHCKAGIGRTGTVAACALIEAGLSPDDALAALARKWRAVAKSAQDPHSPETDTQRAFVRAWAG